MKKKRTTQHETCIMGSFNKVIQENEVAFNVFFVTKAYSKTR